MEDLRIVDGLCLNREDIHFEAKEAHAGIPRDTWDTYSAFANTDGGTIVFGLREEPEGLKAVGVSDVDGKIRNIWNLLNNREFVSTNLLSNSDLKVIDCDGIKLLSMHVPRADRMERPVYTHNNPRNSYRRNGGGDYKCNYDEIAAMMADASRTTADLSIVRTSLLDDFSKKTVASYRNMYRVSRPDSEWNELDDNSFLRILGAAAYDGDVLRPTLAGLLMFGTAYAISFEVNNYCLDYREYSEDSVDWIDRLISDEGDWSGNLFDFYTECCRRIRRTLKHKMIIGKDLKRMDDGVMDKIIREALLNAVVNADYHISEGVVVERREGFVIVNNPGTFRIPLEKAEAGGISDPRNPTVLKMFNLVGFGERAGSGIPRMLSLCVKNSIPRPHFGEQNRPDRVTVTIYTDGSTDRVPLESRIIGMIRNDPKVSISYMSESLGIDRNSISRTLQKMKSKGIVERVDGTRGFWKIPSHE